MAFRTEATMAGCESSGKTLAMSVDRPNTLSSCPDLIRDPSFLLTSPKRLIAGSSPAMTSGDAVAVDQNLERLPMSPAADRSCDLFEGDPARPHRSVAGVSSVPGAELHLIWKRIEPVPSDAVLTITPTATFADCPQLDVICVPGGGGPTTWSTTLRCSTSCASRRRRQIHHLGLHGIAGAGRGRPASRLSRGDALDGDGF